MENFLKNLDVHASGALTPFQLDTASAIVELIQKIGSLNEQLSWKLDDMPKKIEAVKQKYGDNPLLKAVMANNLEDVQLLLTEIMLTENHFKNNINNLNKENKTILDLAMEKKTDKKIIEILKANNAYTFKELLDITKDDIYANGYGWRGYNAQGSLTPFIWAVAVEDDDWNVLIEGNSTENLLELLSKEENFDINQRQEITGLTALHHAMKFSTFNLDYKIEFILSQPNLNINQQDSYGRTALHYLVSKPYSDSENDEQEAMMWDFFHAVILLLLNKSEDGFKHKYADKINLNMVDNKGRTVVKIIKDKLGELKQSTRRKDWQTSKIQIEKTIQLLKENGAYAYGSLFFDTIVDGSVEDIKVYIKE